MKKLFVIAMFSVLVLSACGGGASNKSTDGAGSSSSPAITPTAPVDNLANVVGFLADLGCVTAQYDGNVPVDKNNAVYAKYGIADDAAFNLVVKIMSAADIASAKEQSVTKIKAQCNDAFVKGGVDPTGFVDSIFENSLK